MAQPFQFAREVATVLAHICCTDGRLAQGAPTSPIVSNLICRTLDSQLTKLAREYRLTYTRYADDLTFSYPHFIRRPMDSRLVDISSGLPQVSNELRELIHRQGFRVNDAKTRIDDPCGRKLVTGIVVNEFPNVTREYYRELRGALYLWERYGFESASSTILDGIRHRRYRSDCTPNACKVVWGKLQFMKMVKGAHDAPLIGLVHRFEDLVARDAAVIGLPGPFIVRVTPSVMKAKDARAATWLVTAGTTVDDEDSHEGSAFFVRGVGFITCAHCVSDHSNAAKPIFSHIVLESFDRKHTVKVKVVKIDHDLDIAVLAPDGVFAPSRHLSFNVSAILPVVGEPVIVCGYSGHAPSRAPFISPCNVARIGAAFGKTRIEVDQQLRRGFSGGPLVSARTGAVLGVIATFEDGDKGANSAVPISDVMHL
jgi:RNA-directed DNA polymerase